MCLLFHLSFQCCEHIYTLFSICMYICTSEHMKFLFELNIIKLYVIELIAQRIPFTIVINSNHCPNGENPAAHSTII
jgi:hypothetical protein